MNKLTKKSLRERKRHKLAKQVKEDINRLNKNTNNSFYIKKKQITIEMIEKGIVKHP